MPPVGGLYDAAAGAAAPLILGTDNEGQSVIANLVYGTRTSLIVGLIAGLIGTAIGLVVGLVAGYRGGWVDDMLSAIVNVGLAIPVIVMVILVSVSLPTAQPLHAGSGDRVYRLVLGGSRRTRTDPAACEPANTSTSRSCPEPDSGPSCAATCCLTCSRMS